MMESFTSKCKSRHKTITMIKIAPQALYTVQAITYTTKLCSKTTLSKNRALTMLAGKQKSKHKVSALQ